MSNSTVVRRGEGRAFPKGGWLQFNLGLHRVGWLPVPSFGLFANGQSAFY
jgi:hypothetical protein